MERNFNVIAPENICKTCKPNTFSAGIDFVNRKEAEEYIKKEIVKFAKNFVIRERKPRSYSISMNTINKLILMEDEK
jgi:hypothetical protein